MALSCKEKGVYGFVKVFEMLVKSCLVSEYALLLSLPSG